MQVKWLHFFRAFLVSNQSTSNNKSHSQCSGAAQQTGCPRQSLIQSWWHNLKLGLVIREMAAQAGYTLKICNQNIPHYSRQSYANMKTHCLTNARSQLFHDTLAIDTVFLFLIFQLVQCHRCEFLTALKTSPIGKVSTNCWESWMQQFHENQIHFCIYFNCN